MRKVTEDFIGTCQACFGEFKVNEKNKQIVLHGYKRPGHGYTEGQCAGTDHIPYEYDFELTKEINEQFLSRVIQADIRLAKLKAGEIKSIQRVEREYDKETRRKKPVMNVYTPESDRWDWIVKTEIARTEGDIRYYESMARFFQAKIDTWKPGQVVGIDVPATGRERELTEAYDPVKAAALEERAKLKAERDAKPGKLRVIFYTPELPRPAVYDPKAPGADEVWRKWIEAKDKQQAEFMAGIKAWTKANITGKTIVRSGYGSDLPRRLIEGDPYRFDVAIVNLPWEYRDEITTMFSSAVVEEDAPKRRGYIVAGTARPH